MKIVAIDFDGVINPYTKGFQGKGVFEQPSDTCRQELEKLKKEGWTICINTCRDEEYEILWYLDEFDLPFDYINYSPRNAEQGLSTTKLAADVYIDDRAIAFEGRWHGMADIVNEFKPFYKRMKDGQ